MIPQGRKTCFNALTHRRQAPTALFGIAFSYQKSSVLLHQFVTQVFAAITQIADDDCLRRTDFGKPQARLLSE